MNFNRLFLILGVFTLSFYQFQPVFAMNPDEGERLAIDQQDEGDGDQQMAPAPAAAAQDEDEVLEEQEFQVDQQDEGDDQPAEGDGGANGKDEKGKKEKEEKSKRAVQALGEAAKAIDIKSLKEIEFEIHRDWQIPDKDGKPSKEKIDLDKDEFFLGTPLRSCIFPEDRKIGVIARCITRISEQTEDKPAQYRIHHFSVPSIKNYLRQENIAIAKAQEAIDLGDQINLRNTYVQCPASGTKRPVVRVEYYYYHPELNKLKFMCADNITHSEYLVENFSLEGAIENMHAVGEYYYAVDSLAILANENIKLRDDAINILFSLSKSIYKPSVLAPRQLFNFAQKCYMKAGSDSQRNFATELFEKIIEAKPNDAWVEVNSYAWIAYAYHNQKKYEEAFQIAENVAANKNLDEALKPYVCYVLAESYQMKHSATDLDYSTALGYAQSGLQAAQKSNNDMIAYMLKSFLSEFYLWKSGFVNYGQARKYLEDMAVQDMSSKMKTDAQKRLGLIYFFGLGVVPDMKRAYSYIDAVGKEDAGLNIIPLIRAYDSYNAGKNQEASLAKIQEIESQNSYVSNYFARPILGQIYYNKSFKAAEKGDSLRALELRRSAQGCATAAVELGHPFSITLGNLVLGRLELLSPTANLKKAYEHFNFVASQKSLTYLCNEGSYELGMLLAKNKDLRSLAAVPAGQEKDPVVNCLNNVKQYYPLYPVAQYDLGNYLLCNPTSGCDKIEYAMHCFNETLESATTETMLKMRAQAGLKKCDELLKFYNTGKAALDGKKLIKAQECFEKLTTKKHAFHDEAQLYLTQISVQLCKMDKDLASIDRTQQETKEKEEKEEKERKAMDCSTDSRKRKTPQTGLETENPSARSKAKKDLSNGSSSNSQWR